jgi:hypothetical protein
MGASSKPIRLMVSQLILKYILNLSDENEDIEDAVRTLPLLTQKW